MQIVNLGAAIIAFCLCCTASGVLAAGKDCDRRNAAQGNERVQQGYRHHEDDDRCEGFYVQPISTLAGLEVVAFQLGDLISQIDGLGQSLELSLAGSPTSNRLYELKAHALDPDVYYQLDKVVESHTRYRWNSSTFREFHRKRSALPLGFMACQGRCREARPLYVPVRMAGANGDTLKLVLQARSSLAQVHYKLTKSDTKPLQRSLDAVRFPPRRPIVIDLDPALRLKPGEYQLQVYSVSPNGQLDELRARLLVPPLSASS